MLVGTPGFQQEMIKCMGNVGSCSSVSAAKYKRQ